MQQKLKRNTHSVKKISITGGIPVSSLKLLQTTHFCPLPQSHPQFSALYKFISINSHVTRTLISSSYKRQNGTGSRKVARIIILSQRALQLYARGRRFDDCPRIDEQWQRFICVKPVNRVAETFDKRLDRGVSLFPTRSPEKRTLTRYTVLL